MQNLLDLQFYNQIFLNRLKPLNPLIDLVGIRQT